MIASFASAFANLILLLLWVWALEIDVHALPPFEKLTLAFLFQIVCGVGAIFWKVSGKEEK